VPAAVLQIGERIRAERARKGISLRGLARSVGLSPSLISQIETGKCQPSVSTLYAITTALGVSVQDVFGEAGASGGRMAAGQVTVPAPPPRGGTPESSGPVVCPAQREVLELDSGVIWQRLGRVPGSHVDFLLVSYAPGGCSSPAGRLMQHAGTEYGYLIQGELIVTLGLLSHRLTQGDAVSFASLTPHSYRNEGTVPAVGVWFVAGSDGT
jgi:DNA-binding XRE family transcriptional regulator/quercetin dioxygenase-like cupin family protein